MESLSAQVQATGALSCLRAFQKTAEEACRSCTWLATGSLAERWVTEEGLTEALVGVEIVVAGVTVVTEGAAEAEEDPEPARMRRRSGCLAQSLDGSCSR